MRSNLFIVDDFYRDPDVVREFALQQEFKEQGNYPGIRTDTFLDEGTRETIQHFIYPHGGQVTEWNDRAGLTGSFQICTADERSWIHTDHFNTWAGLIYLTPDPPVNGGTILYRYKEGQQMYEHQLPDYNYEALDMTKWDRVDTIGNLYNRLVMYRSDIFHMNDQYFGKDLNDGRLFQLFFITTEF